MQVGIDPNVVIIPDGTLHTPEGEDYTFLYQNLVNHLPRPKATLVLEVMKSDSTGTTGEECLMVKAGKSNRATKET